MRTNRIITILTTSLVISVCSSTQKDNSTEKTNNPQVTETPKSNEKLHLFLIAIPESALQNAQLPSRLRQEDEDGSAAGSAAPNFAQTGQFLGQIIQGVLGGDFRPVFAGTLGFVEEPTAAANLGNFFRTIAPGLNLALREIYIRAQTRLGFATTTTTTPLPVAQQEAQGSPPVAPITPPTHELTIQEILDGSGNASGIRPSDYVVVKETGQGLNRTITVYFGNDLSNQPGVKQQQMQPQVASQTGQTPSSTTSWQYVLNQIYSETTTAPPLPLIRARTTIPPTNSGEDGDDDGRRRI